MNPPRHARLALLLLAACGQNANKDTVPASQTTDAAAPVANKEAPPPAMSEAPPPKLEDIPPYVPPPDVGGATEQARAPAVPNAPVPAARLAYDYGFSLELPRARVLPLFERHRRACDAAGERLCQVLNASTDASGDTVQATLKLRAEPRWLAAFRGRLGGEAEALDGRLAKSTVAAEDLGRQITDTGARQRALTTLRDRLESLLATRTGKLSDLLEIERELARVEGELDATRSALADMQGRVAMSTATLNYAPDAATLARANARSTSWSGSIIETAALSLRALVQLLAAALPWAAVIGIAALAIRWAMQRRARD